MKSNILAGSSVQQDGKDQEVRGFRCLKFAALGVVEKCGAAFLKTYLLVCAGVCMLLLGAGTLSAQSVEGAAYRPAHQVGLGLLGDAALAAVYYERLLTVKPDRLLVAGKAGFGYNQTLDLCLTQSCGGQSTTYLAVPHHVTANFGEGRSFFEVGAGATYLFSPTNSVYVPYLVLGYRHRPLRPNKVGLRVYGCIPVVPDQLDDISFFPVGLSLGYCF
jgi:hypothetical protein